MNSKAGCYVYILRFLRNGRYYIGSTIDLRTRIRLHKSGHTYTTKRFGEFKVVFTQKIDSISKARTIERKIKSWKRKDFIEKIIKDRRIRLLDSLRE